VACTAKELKLLQKASIAKLTVLCLRPATGGSAKDAYEFYQYLVVLILVSIPTPRQNILSKLRLGVTLLQEENGEDDFSIAIPASQTKNRRPLRLKIPSFIGKFLSTWVNSYRAVFCPAVEKGEKGDSGYLFPRKRGDGIRDYRKPVSGVTSCILGRRILPHEFRSAQVSHSIVLCFGDEEK
jgi:hypothetical protein